MARTLKPMQVDEVKDHHKGVTVPIYYDRNKHDHFAEFMEVTYRDQDIEKLTRKMRDVIREFIKMEFVPVICIKEETVTNNVDSKPYGIQVERVYLAKRPDGKWQYKMWEGERDYPHSLKTPDDLYGITEYKDFNRSIVYHYLPYSDEKYKEAVDLQKALEIAQFQVSQTLKALHGEESQNA